jgi:PST family polysaccharide transporter
MKIIGHLKTNIYSLLIIQAVNIISPLVLIPLYIQHLSIEVYGLYALSLALAAFAQIFIIYSFNFTANRDLAKNKFNSEHQEIISSIRTTQFVIFIGCLFIFPLIGSLFDKGITFTLLVFLNILTFIHQLLFPQWLYHGLNNISTLKNISLGTKIILTILSIIIIPTFKRVELIPVIICLSSICTYFFLRFFKIIKPKLRFYLKIITRKDLVKNLKEGYSLFISQVISQVYIYTPKIILGMFLPLDIIAVYDVSEKILKIAKMPQYIINQGLFPLFAKNYNQIIKKRFELGSLFFSILMVLTIVIISDQIFLFFLGNRQIDYSFFYIMSISLIFIYMSSYNGPLGLIILKKDSLWTKSTFFGLTTYLTLTIVMILVNRITLFNFAVIILLSELTVFLASRKFLNRFDV